VPSALTSSSGSAEGDTLPSTSGDSGAAGGSEDDMGDADLIHALQQSRESTGAGVSAESSNGLSKEDKVLQLKQKLAQKRKVSERAEVEAERQREIQRREDGKKRAETRQAMEEARKAAERSKARKDKEFAAREKERVRALVQQDKEERKAKAEAARRKREGIAPDESPEQHATSSTGGSVATGHSSANASESRLAFRLLDSTVVKNVVPADTPLSELFEFVDGCRDGMNKNYALLCQYPRMKLRRSECGAKTVGSEGLIPSAMLMVATEAPEAPRPSESSPGLLQGVINTAWSTGATVAQLPFRALSWAFGGGAGAAQPQPQQSQEQEHQGESHPL